MFHLMLSGSLSGGMLITTLDDHIFTYACLVISIYFLCNPTEGLKFLGRTLRNKKVNSFIYFESKVDQKAARWNSIFLAR